jgi:hypothetical protein
MRRRTAPVHLDLPMVRRIPQVSFPRNKAAELAVEPHESLNTKAVSIDVE